MGHRSGRLRMSVYLYSCVVMCSAHYYLHFTLNNNNLGSHYMSMSFSYQYQNPQRKRGQLKKKKTFSRSNNVHFRVNTPEIPYTLSCRTLIVELYRGPRDSRSTLWAKSCRILYSSFLFFFGFDDERSIACVSHQFLACRSFLPINTFERR